MASFLDMLAPYLTTATEGVTAYRSGQAEAAAKAEADALAALERRAAEARERRKAELDESTIASNRSLSLLRDAQAQAANQPKAPRTQVVDGQLVNLDTGTASAITGYKAPEKQASTPAAGSFTQFTGPDGRPTFFNPQTGATVAAPAGLTPPSPRTGLPTEAERKAAGLLLTGENGYKNLQRLLGQPEDNPATPEREDEAPGKAAPGFWNRQLSRVGMGVGNIVSPDDLRQIDQAAYDLSEAWLRLTSGAAISAQEIRDQAKAIIPQPGDDPATLAQKARSRRLRVEAVRQAAGRATDPSVRGTADPVTSRLDAAINAELGRSP